MNLHHDDMFDLQCLAQKIMKNRRQDEDGNLVNWLLVNCFRYEKTKPGIIQYRYNFNDDFKQINVCGRRIARPELLLTTQLDKSPNTYLVVLTCVCRC